VLLQHLEHMLHNQNLKLVTMVFLIPLIVGYSAGSIYLEPASLVLKDFNSTSFFITISLKNVTVIILLFFSMFFGKVFLGTFVGINGFLLGILLSKFSSMKYLWLIIPHGVIEIPILLWITTILCQAIDDKRIEKETFKLLGVSLLLILFAAFIESFVTPNIIERVF
jgi:uncharacterized membrane protein SpoIIM required for sporulation